MSNRHLVSLSPLQVKVRDTSSKWLFDHARFQIVLPVYTDRFLDQGHVADQERTRPNTGSFLVWFYISVVSMARTTHVNLPSFCRYNTPVRVFRELAIERARMGGILIAHGPQIESSVEGVELAINPWIKSSADKQEIDGQRF
ncbi:hypothetical protein BDV97DRAFT_365694 [Delphinella strobiligena]|nr:hypothetical protein BDV97DRAFT_365694 [Delphinella strobiligena]